MIEKLENRRLLSASLDPTTGLLTVQGTPAADQINVLMATSSEGLRVIVKVNGATTSYKADLVKRVSIFGLDGNDTIEEAASLTRGSRVDGGGGNDNLRGGSGNDEMFGGPGDDVLAGGAGADQLNGGDGSDTANYADRTEDLVITLDNVANDGKAGEADNVKSDIENVTGGAGNDQITGSSLNNHLIGGRGNDKLIGLDGADILDGGDGNDFLDGGAGNDILTGGGGTDQMYGRDGEDTFFARDLTHDYINGGGGNDKAQIDGDKLEEVTGVETFLA